MDSDSWRRARELFDQALDLPPADRDAFIARIDNHLRGHVERLISDLDGDESLVGQALGRPQVEGQRIGEFRVRGVLGAGGMATVLEAEQEHSQGRVALKIVRFGLVSEVARRRFDFESEILGSLQHPGIAQVFAAGIASDPWTGEDLPYFAMELIAYRREDLELAAARYERARDVFLEVSGTDSHEAIQTSSGLGTVLNRLGRREEAEVAFWFALDHGRERFGGDDRSVLNAANGLAVFYLGRDQLEPLDLAQACQLPERHWLSATFRKGLAVVRIKQGRFAEAEAALLDCLAIFEAASGDQGRRIEKTLVPW